MLSAVLHIDQSDAAAIQAVAAVAIAALTVVLWRTTVRYADKTADMADAMRESNRLTEESALRAARYGAGRLLVRPSELPELRDGMWQCKYLVNNIGQGTVHGVFLQFAGLDDDQTARVLRPIKAETQGYARFDVPQEVLDDHSADHPILRQAKFGDDANYWWMQIVDENGELGPPELATGP